MSDKTADDTFEGEDLDSGDEALLEMLGLSSMDAIDCDDHEDTEPAEKTGGHPLSRLCRMSDEDLTDIVLSQHDLKATFAADRVVQFPQALSLPASFMRRITEEVVWSEGASNGHSQPATYQSDKTYETIRLVRKRRRSRKGHGAQDREDAQNITNRDNPN